MLVHLISILTDWVSKYGYFGIFAFMFGENIGLPIPTEIGFIVGQAMVVAGKSTYLNIFLVILTGQVLGSIITYFMGRFFADKIKFLNESSNLKRAQKVFKGWMKKYGSFAVFISRLIGYIRPWSSYLAGIGEIDFLPFIFYNITGSALITVLTMLVLGTAVKLWQVYPFMRPVAIVLFIIFFFGFWVGLGIYRKVKGRKK